MKRTLWYVLYEIKKKKVRINLNELKKFWVRILHLSILIATVVKPGLPRSSTTFPLAT